VGALNINASLGTEVTMREGSGGSALLEFERIYRDNVGVVTSFFARRCSDPQTVADLTSETIVRAAAGFAGFDPRRGTPRAWLSGIAGHVYAQHCANAASGRDAVTRLAGLVTLAPEEIDELMGRIDAQRAAQERQCEDSPARAGMHHHAWRLAHAEGLFCDPAPPPRQPVGHDRTQQDPRG